MRDLSAHFSRSEFACPDGCGFDTVDVELLEILEAVRQHYNAPVSINSGCRCEEYNKRPEIGGVPNSQHRFGRAADIVVDGVSPADVYAYIDRTWPNELGLGYYDTFTHVDSRAYKARW
jgi:uncharacterized protein YcbK (DUF882 family)